MPDPRSRLYATVKATPKLHEAYDTAEKEKRFAELEKYTRGLLQQEPYASFVAPALLESFDVVGAPSKDWKASFSQDSEYPGIESAPRAEDTPVADDLVVAYAFKSPAMLEEFVTAVARGLTADSNAPISSAGADLGFASADHWCPGTNSADNFGTRRQARRIVAADDLHAAGLRGSRVNVVVIDQGLHQASFKAQNWGGGLIHVPSGKLPGSSARDSHGMMIARTILDLAPDARVYDAPLIPEERIADVTAFLNDAQAALVSLLAAIWLRRLRPAYSGPWILVNAWSIFDRTTEIPLGNYTQNGAPPFGHPMILLTKFATRFMHLDAIFAAGNCGDFCPSPRCGKTDRGPGRSIWGANALEDVITAGAVSCAETWIGASSQGPGPNVHGLARQKPDLCAPSYFRDDRDAALVYSGTSTACAMTAGIVAALRSNAMWYQNLVYPDVMRTALIESARKTQWPGWSERLGHGVLNAASALGRLP